ncbi:GIN domain-containing protein [uncultured Desulfobacter sp.]|uniref:GIN domain-containing protein n=1 Tax=uncultured Desulfobacter sp. TaxID=240139 RepID=UPI0029F4E8D8|nr:DUF2807 domain-containing protein [uncultured Desulfobacter sp.]
MKAMKILIILLFLGISMPVWAFNTETEIQINSTNWVNTGCLEGNGVLKKEKKKLAPFNKIRINGVFNVTIVQQAIPFFEMSADANLFSRIQIRVIKNQLQIDSTGSLCPKLPIKINIGLPELKEVQGLGADDITISNLTNEYFTVNMDGSCDISITGHTKTFTVTMTGAGDLNAFRFKADKISILSSGAGNSEVFATKLLKAHIDGAGDIAFQGHPEKVIVSGDGVGDVIQGD